MVVPLVEEIAKERSDIKVVKINVDEEQELAMQFGVMSIPTLVVDVYKRQARARTPISSATAMHWIFPSMRSLPCSGSAVRVS